jgi:uncharacterized protein YdbL (DUF1318 family)
MKVTNLVIPGGQYSGAVPFGISDKLGTIYVTNVSRLGGNATWGTRLWKIEPGKIAVEILFSVGAMSLAVVNGKLIATYNDGSRAGRVSTCEIDGYVPFDAELTHTVVNIDTAQADSIKQIASHAVDIANKAVGVQNDVTSLRNEVRDLKALVAKLATSEPVVAPTPTVDYNKIADIIWAKLWDSFYLIRMAMNSGNATDANIQRFLVDLTAFIKKVGK